MSDNATVHRETFWMLCDEKIGSGMSRTVYASKVLPNSVIKVEDSVGHFQNIVEWETWKRVQETPFAKWFAPCEWISPCGLVLVMAKTTRPGASEFPAQMPTFLCDFKRANYGMHKGAVVCHDYGTHLMFENGMTKRMKKAEWWDL